MNKPTLHFFLIFSFALTGCRACIEQYDPTDEWKDFEQERQASKDSPVNLDEEGRLIETSTDADQDLADAHPGEKTYQNFCSSCHGTDGMANNAVAQSMNPKPRSFVGWDYEGEGRDEAYIAKIIREGGTAVGKSASMAAWGGVLSEDQVDLLVDRVKAFADE